MADIKLGTNVFDAHFNESLVQNKSLAQLYKELEVSMAQASGKTVYDGFDQEYVKDAEYGLGYFPTNAFDLLDRTVHLPIKKYFVSEFVPIRTGGGVAENIRAFRAQNNPVNMQLASGGNNAVPIVNGTISWYSVPVRGWEAGLLFKNVDLLKAQRGNYSIIEHHEESLRDSYWFRLERNGFIGNIGIDGITSNASGGFVGGLLNQPDARIGGKFTAPKPLQDMDIDEVATYFGQIINAQMNAVRFNRDYFINRIAVAPELRAHWATAPATLGTGGTSQVPVLASQLDYLQLKLEALVDGQIIIGRLPYLGSEAEAKGYDFEESGADKNGKVVFYRQDEKSFYLGVPMPMTLGALLVSPTEGGYRKNGLAFIADGILIHYNETIVYVDNPAWNITYDLDGGTNNVGNPAKLTNGIIPFTLLPATKSAKTFAGWFTDSGLTEVITVLNETKDIKLYAKFVD